MYVRLFDKIYDFTHFRHPGGKEALRLADNRDATSLFLAHHSLKDPEWILTMIENYETDDRVCILVDDTFVHVINPESNTFQGEVISEVKQLFRNKSTKATTMHWLQISILYSLLLYVLLGWFNGELWTLPILPIVMWLAGLKTFHDAAHFALSKNPIVNTLFSYSATFFSSPWDWYHQHTLGHHMYTNIGRADPDLAHAPKLIRNDNSIPWKVRHRTQGKHWILIWTIAVWVGLQITGPLRGFIHGRYNKCVKYSRRSLLEGIFYFLERAASFYVWYLWPLFVYKWYWAIPWTLIPSVIFSLLFMANTQINHILPETTHKKDDNWYKHQVATSHNFGVSGSFLHRWFCYHMSGGLNYQIEHHLFPNMCHCHYPTIQPIVKRLCVKYGMEYNESSGYIEAWRKYIQQMELMSEKND